MAFQLCHKPKYFTKMHKKNKLYSINSTEENQTPESMSEFNLPKIKFPQTSTNGNSYDGSLQTTLFQNSSRFTTAVPQIDYLKYRDSHFSRARTKSPRFQSDCPQFNYFYQPQILRLSPRSKIKVFSFFPIIKEALPAKKTHKRNFARMTASKISNQPRTFSVISHKPNPPEKEDKPALLYGEKLWKLYELAELDRNI